MKHFFIFTTVLFLLQISPIIAAPFTNASMIILLDDSEYQRKINPWSDPLAALSVDLIVALHDNIAPIITSASLLKNVLMYEKEIKEQSIYDLKQQEPKWIYKEISNQLCLLIPRTYNNIPELKDYKKNIASDPRLTNLELKLGLKIDHLKSFEVEDILKKEFPPETLAAYHLDEDFINSLPKVFVTNNDYGTYPGESIPLIKKPRWAIFMSGHGSLTRTVAALSINYFRQVLDFFESKIVVEFFLFTSCYSGGKTQEQIYQDDNKKAVQKTYPFVIASSAISEAQGAIIVQGTQALLDYTTFFEQLRTEDTLDFVTILNSVSLFIFKNKIYYPQNIPLLKLPGREWISVVDVPDKIVSIGKTLAKSRDPQSTLDISTFFAGRIKIPGQKTATKIYPDVILLYAEKIPFPIKLSAENALSEPPTFISMIPGSAVHEFAKIDASPFVLADFINGFFKIQGLESKKLFLIRELIIRKEKNTDPITVKNVAISNKVTPRLLEFIYSLNDQYYTNFWSPDYIPNFNELVPNSIKTTSEDFNSLLERAALIKSETEDESSSLFKANLEELKKFMGIKEQETLLRKDLFILSKYLTILKDVLDKKAP